ncbi:sodium channel subunit beta-2 [Oryzias melastigma]|uniref:sodium channel subunit beta-2 n=1 Tax=Oryzias melastigma TaxID=30732 RepID=UPI000CF800E3|nr:sodium channel subunit beta-2 [Oryzias melastigma]
MWILGSPLFLVLVGSSVSGTSDLNITAGSGENVTLRCEDPNINQDSSLEWNRTDLEKEKHLLSFRSRGVNLDHQDESFQNRVSLKNSRMKDGDLSVVLENVKINDSGTYECRILQKNGSHREMVPISIIHLLVSPPGDERQQGGGQDGGGDKGGLGGGQEEKGTSQGVFVGVVLAVLAVVVVVVVVVVLRILKKKKGSTQSSDNHQDVELDLLDMNSNPERNPADSAA